MNSYKRPDPRYIVPDLDDEQEMDKFQDQIKEEVKKQEEQK